MGEGGSDGSWTGEVPFRSSQCAVDSTYDMMLRWDPITNLG